MQPGSLLFFGSQLRAGRTVHLQLQRFNLLLACVNNVLVKDVDLLLQRKLFALDVLEFSLHT